jgi:parallel beta-helix repeat protein
MNITINNQTASNNLNNELNATYVATEPNIINIDEGFYNLDVDYYRIKNKNNIQISGKGPNNTILINGGIIKNSNENTEYIEIKNLQIDARNKLNRNCINLNVNTKNINVNNVICRNTSNLFLFHWHGVDNMLVSDCSFIDGGTASGVDNAAGGQTITNENYTLFKNNYFYKSNKSKGGGLLTTGQTGNLMVSNNFFDNRYGVAYAGFSCESQEGNSKNLLLENNTFLNCNINFGTGNLSNRIQKAILNKNKFFESNENFKKILGGIISHRVDECVISNNYLESSKYGIFGSDCKKIKIENNEIYEINPENDTLIDKSCIYLENCGDTIIKNNKIFNFKNNSRWAIYIKAKQDAIIEITDDNLLFNFESTILTNKNQTKEAIKFVNPEPINGIQGKYKVKISQNIISKYNIILPEFVTLI